MYRSALKYALWEEVWLNLERWGSEEKWNGEIPMKMLDSLANWMEIIKLLSNLIPGNN